VPSLSALEVVYDDALYKSTFAFTLLFFSCDRKIYVVNIWISKRDTAMVPRLPKVNRKLYCLSHAVVVAIV